PASRFEDVSTWKAGVYIIRALVDPEDLQEELDEGNNTLDKQLFIIDSARIRWIYPDFPIPLEKPEDEVPIGAIASGVALATVEEQGREKTVIYFGSNDEHLYALNADGTERWKYPPEGEPSLEPIKTTPVVAQDRIYFGSDDGHLYVVDSNGQFVWQFPAGGEPPIGAVKAAPALLKDASGAVEAIYFGSDDGSLYALNPDGSLRWKFTTGAFIWTTPAIGPDGTIYFGSGDGRLYALRDKEVRAEERWHFSTGSFIKSSPVIFNETIYFGSSDGHLYALFLDGTKKWQYPEEGKSPIGAVESTPLVVEDKGATVIYFGSNEGSLYKLEDQGDEAIKQWQFHEYEGISLGPVRSSPVKREEGDLIFIYFGSDDGTLYALRDRGATVGDEWVFPTRGAITGTPAIDEATETLYLPSWEGHLYALEI
ncbi:TPA: hypothetical protein EYP12_02325, partial [Candidatus Bipolaricaulota bacterium]|nr:hypothetical protein [Candidatus Bipolaricaulota bacterium]